MRYQIADCIVEYEPIYEFLRKKMESYRFDGDAKTQITLTMTEELCIQKQAEQPHLTLEECEYIFVGLEFYRKLLLQGGMMIHASAVEVGWQSLSVFCGQWNREIYTYKTVAEIFWS